MVLNNNDAALCVESIHPRPGSIGEIDLYPELDAFARLSPDEQARMGNRSSQSAEFSTSTLPITTESTSETPAAVPELQSPQVPEGDERSAPKQFSESVPATTQEPLCEMEVSIATGDRLEATVPQPPPSGPLPSVSPPQSIVYTGSMSRGVCLACGAESDSDDLFCLSCGEFVDEVASPAPSTTTCRVCNHRIDPDEIFCPWCGAGIAH